MKPPARKAAGQKGKVHPDAYSAEQTLRHAREACRQGWLAIDDRVYDQLLTLQVPLAQARHAIEAALAEITPADAKPPDFTFDPPGQGFGGSPHSSVAGCISRSVWKTLGPDASCTRSMKRCIHPGGSLVKAPKPRTKGFSHEVL